ncbi:MAG: response regulator [Pseudohongiella sp.]|nr:response regulator [Pseudohongiella sp.]
MTKNESLAADIANIRGNLTNRVLIAISFIAVPGLVASLLRIQAIGIQPVMGIHIIAACTIWIVTICRNRIPYRVRATIIIIVFFLVGLGGLMNLALNGAGLPFLVISVVFCAVLIGKRASVVVLVAGAFAIFLFGFAYSSELLELKFEPSLYNVAASSWITTFFSFMLLGGGAIITIVGLNSALFKSVIDLQRHSAHLENKVNARTRNLTEEVNVRKQNEHELEDSRQRIIAIVENVNDGIITIDARGIIETFNNAAENIFAYSRVEVFGKNVKMLMPDPYRREHDGYIKRFRDTGEARIIGTRREVTGRRKDGSTFPMELSIGEMQVMGKQMFTGVVQDITERKKLELMKDEFISTVSHELRTPLTSIRGALGLVLGKSAAQLPEKARSLLEMADRNSERLTLLINDILDLEKIEAGQIAFRFANIDLVELLRQAVLDNEGYAHRHKVKLMGTSTLEQAFVLGDELRLMQVFSNLISNAVKFSPEQGEVEVAVTLHEESYRVTVRDYGSGIADEFHDRIFKRFAQADSSDSREKGGTGLGLSISKAIVERHQGHIGFESERGKGTVFHFDLPNSSLSSTENEQLADAQRVLICEDNADVATILAAMLEGEGLVSDIAGSAAATRALLSRHDYCLLLLDLSLPDMDGLQLLRELRAEPATAELPIIVVSVRADEGRSEFNGNAITVIDWIQKPVDEARLSRAVQQVLLNGRRPHILHVEDDADIVQVIKVLLKDMADLSNVPSVRDARKLLEEQDFDLVILDLGLADGSGIELLDEIKDGCPIIIFSAQQPDREITAQVTAALTKSTTSNDQLLATIKQALKG